MCAAGSLTLKSEQLKDEDFGAGLGRGVTWSHGTSGVTWPGWWVLSQDNTPGKQVLRGQDALSFFLPC